jgi:hypothetical protein
MSRRTPRTLLALAALAAVTAAAPATAGAARKPAKKPKKATDAWVVERVQLDGVVKTAESDRGYTGIARYVGVRRAMEAFSLTPGAPKRPRLFTAVVPIAYTGSSQAAIREVDKSWNCGYTMEGLMLPETLPVTFTVTTKSVHLYLTTVPPGIRCPEEAPAWTFEEVGKTGRSVGFDLSRAQRVKRGGRMTLPVNIKAGGSRDGVTWKVAWSGELVFKRTR